MIDPTANPEWMKEFTRTDEQTLERLANVETMIKQCNHASVDRAVDQLNKAKRELYKGNKLGANWFLASAEDACIAPLIVRGNVPGQATKMMRHAVMGEDHSKDQSERAKHSRGKITDEGETIGDLIDRLALEKDALGDYVTAPSLWDPLFSALNDAGTSPKETRNNGKPRKSYYRYTTSNGKGKTIQRDTFENKIMLCRKKLSR